MILPKSYFQNPDVVSLAKDLIGKTLHTQFNKTVTSVIITETEAYAGATDKASHAYGNKLTNRTKTMFESGGIAYIYLIYGMYSLFNIVTNVKGIPHAILIRGGFPLNGLDIMESRINGKKVGYKETTGPGKLSKLLGIHYELDGIELRKFEDKNCIWLEDHFIQERINSLIQVTTRIGIDYAEEDAQLPYRFLINNRHQKYLESIRKDLKTNQ